MKEESEIQETLKEIEGMQPAVSAKHKYILWMYYERYERSITEEDVFKIMEEVKKITSKQEDTIIDIILSSGGGNIYAAYKIVKILRDKCSELNIAIPLYAKSAATLISLAANKIYMAPQSELGPLDFIMEHPTEEGIQISALDGVAPVEYFTGVGVNIMKKVFDWVRNEISLGRKDSLEIARCYADDCIKPILAKLDPSVVNMCYRELLKAYRYGLEFLTEYMFSEEKNKVRKASGIMKELVWEYPSHSFAIDFKQAHDLGLKVFRSTEYANWELLWKEFLKHEEKWHQHISLEKVEDLVKRYA